MDSLREGYAQCAAVTQKHARTFHLASRVLDRETRRGSYAVYAFCRHVDDTVDEAVDVPREELLRRVQGLRDELARVYSHAPLAEPRLLALRSTVRTFGIERAPFEELIDGVAWDVSLEQVQSVQELERYCYLVAGTVGLLMARLFRATTERALPHAIALGVGMQLTNILRDVQEDFVQRNRVYLPLDRMEHHGVRREDLRASSASPGLRALVQELAVRAREQYASASLGVPMLGSRTGRAATRIMGATYGAILEVLEAREWDVLAGRAVVPTQRKLALAAQAMLG